MLKNNAGAVPLAAAGRLGNNAMDSEDDNDS